MTKADQKQIEIQRHLANLKALGYIPENLKPIQNLERQANRMATNECNGVKEYKDTQWNKIEGKVKGLFNQPLYGLILNGDPRGYTLKIDDSIMKSENYKLCTDRGGYGILSPTF